MRADIPDALIEVLDETALPGWLERESAAARDFGDRWIGEARSVALSVPALPCRPVGRILIVNPAHPDLPRVTRGVPFIVPWDERLFS